MEHSQGGGDRAGWVACRAGDWVGGWVGGCEGRSPLFSQCSTAVFTIFFMPLQGQGRAEQSRAGPGRLAEKGAPACPPTCSWAEAPPSRSGCVRSQKGGGVLFWLRPLRAGGRAVGREGGQRFGAGTGDERRGPKLYPMLPSHCVCLRRMQPPLQAPCSSSLDSSRTGRPHCTAPRMLRRDMPHCPAPCCAMLCHVIPCHAMPCYAILSRAAPRCAALCHAAPRRAAPHLR